MRRALQFVLAFAFVSSLALAPARADEGEADEPATAFDAIEKDTYARGWTGIGYFRSAAQTRRGPVTYDGKLVMALNFALDLSRRSYSLELVPRGFNEATTLGSRTWNLLLGPNVVRTEYKYGALVEGLVLRARFAKYVAQGEKWRLGAGVVLSDLIHVAENDLEKKVPAVQDAWFVTAGPLLRLDFMLAEEVQARLGAAAAMGVFRLKESGTRPYPVSLFGHFRFPYHLFVGIESSLVVGVPHVFSQRHELHLGFFG